LTAPTISPRCYLTGPSRLSAVDTTLTTMHCLWWLRSRRSKPERHERTRSSETCADSGSVSLPLQRTEAVQQRSHSRSHSLPRTPPSRLLQDDSDSSLSSISSGSIVVRSLWKIPSSRAHRPSHQLHILLALTSSGRKRDTARRAIFLRHPCITIS
jgi:hypothetical protein